MLAILLQGGSSGGTGAQQRVPHPATGSSTAPQASFGLDTCGNTHNHTLLLGVSVATLIVYHRVTSARRMSCIKSLVSSVVQITILWAKQGRRQHVAVQ